MSRVDRSRFASSRWLLAALAAAVMFGALLLFCGRHPRPVMQAKAVARQPARVLARVGSVEITDEDLARHQAVQRLTVGEVGEREALQALCDRALLILEAGERHLTVDDAELAQQALRRQLVIGAMAASDRSISAGIPSAPPGIPAAPRRRVAASPAPAMMPSPFERGAQVLSQHGLSVQDLAVEVAADTLSDRAKERRDAAELERLLARLRTRWKVEWFL